MPTVSSTINDLQLVLREYIEATYHVGHPGLIAQRAALLKLPGLIHQAPYIESTPRYRPGPKLDALGIPAPAAEVLLAMTAPNGAGKTQVYNPPYAHQGRALKEVLANGKSVLVMTGTGSGKTECFTFPILGRLAEQAARSPASFAQHAVRALILYPMNALVNDQLGRLRLLLGDPRVVQRFTTWAGRPARFAMYTGRATYPGVRTKKRDMKRLESIKHYFIEQEDRAATGDPAAKVLVDALKERGKWPAKPQLNKWYGSGPWQHADGTFRRAVTLPGDPELLTRHEVQEAPPDVLVTNYSMLEYMMMRPLERPIFDKTRAWLEQNPTEKFLLVVDEAHMYHGAMGAEVALLIRRLAARLGLSPARLQVICTSASFNSEKDAGEFAADLVGKVPGEIVVIGGDPAYRPNPAQGSARDVALLNAVDLRKFDTAEGAEARLEVVRELLKERGVQAPADLAGDLYRALEEYPPMSLLINATMGRARPVSELGEIVFGRSDPEADRAVAVLLTLGSAARKAGQDAPLLPSRVHAFFRGLPGLWVCLDPDCTELPPQERGGPTGKLYGQPRARCGCGSRVFELYTCRDCGAAYARAYTDDLTAPRHLWPEPGASFETLVNTVREAEPLDLLLEAPERKDIVERRILDLPTGLLNPADPGERSRTVWIRKDRSLPPGTDAAALRIRLGQMNPCGVCGKSDQFRSKIQDHQTKGDEPFQALVAKQLQVQATGPQKPTTFAPLQGRKVLVFSDSRQVAARLAPSIQRTATRDALRPLIVGGWAELAKLTEPSGEVKQLTLDDLYAAVLIGAIKQGVRLRVALQQTERLHYTEIREALADPEADWRNVLAGLVARAPEALLREMHETLLSRYYGLRALGLASIRESTKTIKKIQTLPNLGDLASTDTAKVALVRRWLSYVPGLNFKNTPAPWLDDVVKATRTGMFSEFSAFLGTQKGAFESGWLPKLKATYLDQVNGKLYLKAGAVALELGGEWAYCDACKSTERPFPGRSECPRCGAPKLKLVDPDTDPVFVARKGFYRAGTRALLAGGEAPVPLVAAEHTAQLGGASGQDVFSKAEENELLFQDIDLGASPDGQPRHAIDVLSCTTTMEVGIDIGSLSGVALRNLPPARANYQQRAGRAGRRGNAVATVVSFGSADSHDEHYFSRPAEMISGKVDDPTLTLDNPEITRRHVTAFLLQRYLNDRIDDGTIRLDDEAKRAWLFEVLGKAEDFRKGNAAPCRSDFERWLTAQEARIRAEVRGWMPRQLAAGDVLSLTEPLAQETLKTLDEALKPPAAEEGGATAGAPETDAEDSPDEAVEAEKGEDEDAPDAPLESTEEPAVEAGAPPQVAGAPAATRKRPADVAREDLLSRLLARGVLPRYAFPTDVTTFYVFDERTTDRFRAEYLYAAQQGLSVALTQYAPGKGVWIGDKKWRSGALYSPFKDERYLAFERRQLYLQCSRCGYAELRPQSQAKPSDKFECPACHEAGETLGPAMPWVRPPGFAHPFGEQPGTVTDDTVAKSYATSAKLQAPGPRERADWEEVNPRVRVHAFRKDLLVTNRGPRGRGYTYCLKCGRIEPTVTSKGLGQAHQRPFKADPPACPRPMPVNGVVLGSKFLTDVGLMLITAEHPVSLLPGKLGTDVALKTVCEALSKAATDALGLEPGEVQAEYRPALTEQGAVGSEVEIFLYDTLPGGAGFSRRAIALKEQLLIAAEAILEGCAEQCDSSCYRCLRSFRNRFEHHLLDRHVGLELLRYMRTGALPALSDARVRRAYDTLYEDLCRQHPELQVARDVKLDLKKIGEVVAPVLVKVPGGAQVVACLKRPLTADTCIDDSLETAKNFQAQVTVLPLDEMVIAGNLPAATQEVVQTLGGAP